MKAPKAWPQIIEIPPAHPDQRNADPAATSKISAFDLEQVLARSSRTRTTTPTSTDEVAEDRRTAPPMGNTSDEALLAKLKPEVPRADPVIHEKALEQKEPLPGSLDAGWEDPPDAVDVAPAAEPAKPEVAPISEVASRETDSAKTAPPPPLTKTAPPPGTPTPLLPGAVGVEGLARFNSDPPDGGEEATKVGDSLIESLRGSKIANLADDEADDEAEQEGLTVIGDSLRQSGMIDAPNVEALTAMKPVTEAKEAKVAIAPDEPALPPLTTDELPKLSDDLKMDSSAPPSNDPAAKPLSLPVASSPPSSSPVSSSPAPQALAANARPAWMSSRVAIVAGVLLALVTLLVAMRMLRH